MSGRFRCAPASAARAEPLFATASVVSRWVLVEEPGGWGANALRDSRLPSEVGRALEERGRRVGARVLLVRRHGRYAPRGRTAFFVSTSRHRQRVERLHVESAAEVLDVDWEPLRDGGPVAGAEVARPLFLVCTNGRHDLCCAERGRPVAAALDAVLGEQVWESSHFGGDRFAANVVCFPHGVYYGRVNPLHAVTLARDYAQGRLHPDHYRGRSCYPFAVQAAEYFARERLGVWAVDALPLVEARRESGSRTWARFATPTGETVAVLVDRDAGAPQQLTCRAEQLRPPPRYRLVRLATEPGDR